MGYIPEGAEWYLAEIVEELIIEDEPDNLVFINIVLVHADSPEDAYEKACLLGEESQQTFINTDGKTVTSSFRGLRELNVIFDELEHGAELIYERKVGLTSAQLQQIVRPKEKLGIFRPIAPDAGPNIIPLDIAQQLDELL